MIKKRNRGFLSGEPIYDLEELKHIEFPEHPVKVKEHTTFDDSVADEFPREWEEICQESNCKIQDNPSRLSQFTGSSNARTILTWQKVREVDEDVEVAALVHSDGPKVYFEDSDNSLFQLHLHSSGTADYENTYYIDLNKEVGKNNISINRILDKIFTYLASEEVSINVSTNQWYNVVFKRDGGALKGKVWPYGTDEPNDWQVVVKDASHKSGYIGLGQARSTSINEYLQVWVLTVKTRHVHHKIL